MFPPPSRKRGEGLHQPLLSVVSTSPPRPGLTMPIGMHVRTQPLAPQRQRGTSPGRKPLPSRPLVGALQQQAATRQRDKWIPLPEETEGEGDDSPSTSRHASRPGSGSPPGSSASSPPPSIRQSRSRDTLSLFEDLPEHGDTKAQGARITVYSTADRYDRRLLDERLRAHFPASAIKSYPDVFYVEFFPPEGSLHGGDVFVFDYGCVACWGLTRVQETALLKDIVQPCAVGQFRQDDFEIDQFTFQASALDRPPGISNDVITLHRKAARDHKAKLAISYALGQSTKLSLHERRVLTLVGDTRSLPEALAASGDVHLPHGMISRLMGRVFLEKSSVNLLTPVLDTPEFFWIQTADALQSLYERMCDYLELDNRVLVLNERFGVLHDLLEILRDFENTSHSVRLTAIVIWLMVVCCVVGLLEVGGLFGLIGHHE